MRPWREFAVFVPMGEERLCAVVTGPGDGAAGHDLGVVLLTGGNYTRTHRNRMWVRTARALAEKGFASIRVDYHGVGDSTGTAHFDMEVPFDRDALAAAAFLKRATGVTKLAVVATCFGGRSAMAAAAQDPDAVGISVAPLPLRIPRSRQPVPVRSKVRIWMKRYTFGTKLLQHPAVRRLRGRAAARRERPPEQISPRFKRDVVEVLRRGGAVKFLYGELTEGLGELRQCIAEIEPDLSLEQRARIEVDLAGGTSLLRFQTLEDQDIVVGRAVAFVEGLQRSLAPASAPRP